jgi:alpha-tubulin suppressor-like RCC1 family protein
MRQRPLTLRGLALLPCLALALLAACGGGDPAPADAARAAIGPAGGTVATPAGASVVVPPGALADVATLGIERSAIGAPELPQGFSAGSAVFAFTPHGTRFGVPVTVRIPVDPASVAAGLTPTLYKTDDAGVWQRVPGATLSGTVLTAEVTGFSWFAYGAAPPLITLAPQDLRVHAGDSASFQVNALGTPPFRYQWQRSADAGATFADIPGATARSVTLATTAEADNGARLRVVVSNDDGPAISRSATLTVLALVQPPTITTQPAATSVVVGDVATFSVAATGTAPLYQWQLSRDDGQNFADVPGASNASLSTAAATLADDGVLVRVRIDNAAGSVTSAPARWTVTAAPPVQAGAAAMPMAAGADFSVVVLADGTLRSWGADAGGSLGDGGSDLDRSTPGTVAGLGDVVAVAAQGGTALALRRNGEVWGWGQNGLGALGNGGTAPTGTPTRFLGTPALGAARAVATGGAHSLVLRVDGRIEASGHNVHGQLGNPAAGYLSERGVEVMLTAGMRPVVAIAAGEGFSVALDESGVVWTWGHNSSGQLGHGTTTGTAVPQRVVGIDPVQMIAAGQDHVLAVARDGQLWSWGSNRNGKLGQGNVGPFLAQPGRVLLTGQIVAIAAGAEHSVSLHFDGTVFTWGINETGQLGNGSGSPGMRHTPGFVSLLPSDIRAIAAGGGLGHSLALAGDGRVWAWGHNRRGQLGDGSLESRPAPVAVPSLNLN